MPSPWNRIRITTLTAMLLVASASGATRVASITMCEDVEGSDFIPINITSRFSPEVAAIHAVVQLEDVQAATRVRGVFVSVDAISTPNYEIDGSEMVAQPGAATAHFSLSRPNRGWPPGNYKFNLYLDGKLAAVSKFSIAGAPAQSAAPPPRAEAPQAPPPAPPMAGAEAMPTGPGFTGSYTMQAQGVALTLTLRQDNSGNITGTLSSTSGTQFSLEGQVEEGTAMGICQGDGMATYFQAEQQGDRLLFALIEVDPTTNMPNYERARQLEFVRQRSAGREPTGGMAPQGMAAPQAPRAASEPANQPQGAGAFGAGNAGAPGEVSDPGWGFAFSPPPGWNVKHDQSGALLGHNSIAGLIIVMPHNSSSFQQVQQQLMQGLQDEETQLQPAGALQQISQTALAGDYQGTYQNQPVKARGIGTFSPHGGGAYILAVTTPDKYGRPLAAAAEQIATQMRYFRPQVSELVQYFAGMWANVTPNTMTNLNLYPDGTYDDVYEASYSGNDPGTGVTDWGLARQDKNRGRWTARGTREQGVIILTKPDGTQIEMQYQVHRERGETYWREYFFNGKLYSKQR